MLLLSIAGELLQLLASGRAMMVADVIFNYAGAYTGVMLVYLLINKKKAKEQTT
jgi:VanZ family protein